MSEIADSPLRMSVSEDFSSLLSMLLRRRVAVASAAAQAEPSSANELSYDASRFEMTERFLKSPYEAIFSLMKDRNAMDDFATWEEFREYLKDLFRQIKGYDRVTMLPMIRTTFENVDELSGITKALVWQGQDSVADPIWMFMSQQLFDARYESSMPVIALLLSTQLPAVMDKLGFRLHIWSRACAKSEIPSGVLSSVLDNSTPAEDVHLLFEDQHLRFVPLVEKVKPISTNESVAIDIPSSVSRIPNAAAPQAQLERNESTGEAEYASDDDRSSTVTMMQDTPPMNRQLSNLDGVHNYLDEFKAQTLTYTTLAKHLRGLGLLSLPSTLEELGFTDDGTQLVPFFHQLAFLRWAIEHEQKHAEGGKEYVLHLTLADDVGLGKTLEMLLLSRLNPTFPPGLVNEQEPRINATLLIVPLQRKGDAITQEWMSQIRRFQCNVNGISIHAADIASNFAVAELIPTKHGIFLRHLVEDETDATMLFQEEAKRKEIKEQQRTMKGLQDEVSKTENAWKKLSKKKNKVATSDELVEALQAHEQAKEKHRKFSEEVAKKSSSKDGEVPDTHVEAFPRERVLLSSVQQLQPYTLLIISSQHMLSWDHWNTRIQCEHTRELRKSSAAAAAAATASSVPNSGLSNSDQDSLTDVTDLTSANPVEVLTPAKQFVQDLWNVKWLRIVMDEAHTKPSENAETSKLIEALKCAYKWSISATPTPAKLDSLNRIWRSQFSKEYPSTVAPAKHVLLLHEMCPITEYFVHRRRDNKDQLHGKGTNQAAYFNCAVIHPFTEWLSPLVEDLEIKKSQRFLEMNQRSMLLAVLKEIMYDLRGSQTKVHLAALKTIRYLHSTLTPTTTSQERRNCLGQMIHLCASSLSWIRIDQDGNNARERYPSDSSAETHLLTRLLLKERLDSTERREFLDLVHEVRNQGTTVVTMSQDIEMKFWALIMNLTLSYHDSNSSYKYDRNRVYPASLPPLPDQITDRIVPINRHLVCLQEQMNSIERHAVADILTELVEKRLKRLLIFLQDQTWQWLNDAIANPEKAALLRSKLKFSDDDAQGLPQRIREWIDLVQDWVKDVCTPLIQFGSLSGTSRCDMENVWSSDCLSCSECVQSTSFSKAGGGLGAIAKSFGVCKLHSILRRHEALVTGWRYRLKTSKLTKARSELLPKRPLQKEFEGTYLLEELKQVIGNEILIAQRRALRGLSVNEALNLNPESSESEAVDITVESNELNELLCLYERVSHYTALRCVNSSPCIVCREEFWQIDETCCSSQSAPTPTPTAAATKQNQDTHTDTSILPALEPDQSEPMDVFNEDVRPADEQSHEIVIDAAFDAKAELLEALKTVRFGTVAPKLSSSKVFQGRIVDFGCPCKCMVHASCYHEYLQKETNFQICPSSAVNSAKFVFPLSSLQARDRKGCEHQHCRKFHEKSAVRVDRTHRLDLLVEHIQEKPPTEKVVIFSKYASALQVAHQQLTAARIPCVMLENQGKGIEKFRCEGVTFKVLLVKLSAGNAGLNLQAAAHAIFLDPADDFAQHTQAVGRVVRTGQRKPVTITHLIAQDFPEEVRTYIQGTTSPNNANHFLDRLQQIQSLPTIAPGSLKMRDFAISSHYFWKEQVKINGESMSRERALQLAEQGSTNSTLPIVQIDENGMVQRTELLTFVDRANCRILLETWKKLQSMIYPATDNRLQIQEPRSDMEAATQLNQRRDVRMEDLSIEEIILLQEALFNEFAREMLKNATPAAIIAHTNKRSVDYPQSKQNTAKSMDKGHLQLQSPRTSVKSSENEEQERLLYLSKTMLPSDTDRAARNCRRGLQNPMGANLCYLNAALQALFGLVDADQPESDQTSCLYNLLNRTRSVVGVGQHPLLSKLAQLYHTTAHATTESSLALPIQTYVNGLNQNFRVGTQHDAAELLTVVGDAIRSEESSSDSVLLCQGGFRQLCVGSVIQNLRCSANAAHERSTSDVFQLLMLPLTSSSGTVQSNMDAYCEEQMVNYRCNSCPSLTATKYLRLTKLPQYLFVQLLRAMGDGKNEEPVHLDGGILRLHAADGTKAEYEAISLILHHGNTITSGHYTTVVRRSNNQDSVRSGNSQWIHYNDECVLTIPCSSQSNTILASPFIQKRVYIIFYRKVRDLPANSGDTVSAVQPAPDLPMQNQVEASMVDIDSGSKDVEQRHAGLKRKYIEPELSESEAN